MGKPLRREETCWTELRIQKPVCECGRARPQRGAQEPDEDACACSSVLALQRQLWPMRRTDDSGRTGLEETV